MKAGRGDAERARRRPLGVQESAVMAVVAVVAVAVAVAVLVLRRDVLSKFKELRSTC